MSMPVKSRTLFGYINAFLVDVKNRIGDPSPDFFKVMLALWTFVGIAATAILQLPDPVKANLPSWLVPICYTLTGGAIGGAITAGLTRDPKKTAEKEAQKEPDYDSPA